MFVAVQKCLFSCLRNTKIAIVSRPLSMDSTKLVYLNRGVTSRFVMTVTLCNIWALCNNSLSHFVIPDALCNNSLSHFVIPDALCNNSLSHFVVPDALCNNSLSLRVIPDAYCNTLCNIWYNLCRNV